MEAPPHWSIYRKALDGRNNPIRGLWIRGERFYGQIRIAEAGRVKARRVPLTTPDGAACATVADAKKALERLKTQRDDDNLPALRQTPKLVDYVPVYLEHCRITKRPQTLRKETYTLRFWVEYMGQRRLSEIRKAHVMSFRDKRLASGASKRTANLDVIALRRLLKHARDKDMIARLPTDGVSEIKTVPPKRSLTDQASIDRIVEIGFEPRFNGRPLKNAQQLSDYLKLLRYTGAREKEALRLRWSDVDFDLEQLTIGSDGLSKNHRARVIDFNPKLRDHLIEMQGRRAPDSLFLFPSPQRGENDRPSCTFRESMRQARDAAGLPKSFGFHDLRHAFASSAVMAGVDFLTLATWLGHRH